MAAIIPNLAAIMVGVGQNFPMSACEPTVHCTLWPGLLAQWLQVGRGPARDDVAGCVAGQADDSVCCIYSIS